jgi:hypothetical protein
MTKASVKQSDQVSEPIIKQKKNLIATGYRLPTNGESFAKGVYLQLSHTVLYYLMCYWGWQWATIPDQKILCCQKCLSTYLWVISTHYPNPVKHFHNVLPQILPTVVAWDWPKANDLSSQLPFLCLYLNPMCCYTKKCHLCHINCPTIWSYRDWTQGFLSFSLVCQ